MFCFLGERIAPVIQSVGPPPERHADRTVNLMLDWLREQSETGWRAIWAEIRPGTMGNPLAQTRAFQRIQKAGGYAFIASRLTPAKRNRWSAEWHVWSPSDVAGKLVPIKDALPEWAGVSCAILRIEGVRGDKPKTDVEPIALFTHHALSRVLQRAEARTAVELV